MKKNLLLAILLFCSCNKELDITIAEINCVPPTFVMTGRIIGHETDSSKGALYVFPLSGDRPFKVSIDGGKTFLPDKCDMNGNFSIGPLAPGLYELCIKDKDGQGCLSEVFKAEIERR
jgi:hypothetical protein